jgi:hypothetical protein
LPEHCFVPGTHTPVHTPFAHANGHADAVPHWPLELQVCTALPEHWVVVGTHTPTHDADDDPVTQADATHATGEPHWPPELHVCKLLPEHCVAPGMHDPVHSPFTHAWLPHGTAAP